MGPAGAWRDHGTAAAWGFAEATAFFIVPDVWLSAVALRSPRRGLRCVVPATVGALAGAVLTRHWGARVPAAGSARALATLPGISPAMVARVERRFARHPRRALVTGPLSGTPYKIYARTAGLQDYPLSVFLVWSVPARTPRFLLVTGTVGALGVAGRRYFPRAPAWLRWGTFGAGWAGFYTWFFRNVGH